MSYKLIYKPYGEHSILIEWPAKIDKHILFDVLSFKEKIVNNNIKSIVNINHAYNSLLIIYEKFKINFNDEILLLKQFYASNETIQRKTIRLWKIPVCYDEIFGIDLEVISKEKNISKQDIIKKHTSSIYTVYFTGFLPGFLYLGGLDEVLHFPRKATPRLKTEKGAVAIGGNQTGIYPNESPGGWHIIGNSPLNFFDVKKETPCFASAGDSIQFYAVPIKAYNDIKTLVEADVYQIESEVIHD